MCGASPVRFDADASVNVLVRRPIDAGASTLDAAASIPRSRAVDIASGTREADSNALRERAMSVAGTYDIVVKSPLGDQKSTLTVAVSGDCFTGSNVGAAGAMEITDGKVDGQTITWSSQLTSPMPMKLDCQATIDGDAISGTVTAGMFGSFPLSGTRTG
jgi:hypothetical protein